MVLSSVTMNDRAQDAELEPDIGRAGADLRYAMAS